MTDEPEHRRIYQYKMANGFVPREYITICLGRLSGQRLQRHTIVAAQALLTSERRYSINAIHISPQPGDQPVRGSARTQPRMGRPSSAGPLGRAGGGARRAATLTSGYGSPGRRRRPHPHRHRADDSGAVANEPARGPTPARSTRQVAILTRDDDVPQGPTASLVIQSDPRPVTIRGGPWGQRSPPRTGAPMFL